MRIVILAGVALRIIKSSRRGLRSVGLGIIVEVVAGLLLVLVGTSATKLMRTSLVGFARTVITTVELVFLWW